MRVTKMGIEKGDIVPVLLKLGAALALSLAGLTYTRFRLKQCREIKLRNPQSTPSDDGGNSVDLDFVCREEQERTWIQKNSSVEGDCDCDVLFLPVDAKAAVADESDEVLQLKEMVKVLKERERGLEMQLLEYYGLKEQQNSVLALQNRVNISNTEARLFSLKMEALQADNRRLQEELDICRGEIMFLKRKLKIDARQSKEEIMKLREKVEKVYQEENQISQKVEETSKEKSELLRRLQETKIVDETNRCLKGENVSLSTEIERLQEDRCADVEEVVYLRWLNACLRYELRNYQHPEGKTIARDLEPTSNPISEEKAKQLILKYSHKFEEEGLYDLDLDLDSERLSSLEDSCKFDESSSAESSSRRSTSKKLKFFSKLKKLVHRNNLNRASSAAGVGTRKNYCTSADFGCLRKMTSPPRPCRYSLDLQKPEVLSLDDEDLEILRNCENLVMNKKNSSFDHESDLEKYATALMNNRTKKMKSHRRSSSCH